jgi:ribosomal protein S18 acetylase RimI-like enzyme
MAQYGSGGTATKRTDAAGIRLLAVAPAARARGVGKALARDCIERARALGRSSVVLHTTRAMETAWRMYEQLGFRRSPDLDFRQGELEVFGFELPLR